MSRLSGQAVVTTLCDRDVIQCMALGQLDVEPFDPSRLQPASLDLTLANDFQLPKTDMRLLDSYPYAVLGEREKPVSMARWERCFPEYRALKEERYTLPPLGFILGRTVERVRIGPLWRARVEGKSTLGRLGLMVHCTAGYIDPGFQGTITLELFNVAPYAITLVAGEPVCQLAFERLSGRPDCLYGDPRLQSHYQGQQGTQPPKL